MRKFLAALLSGSLFIVAASHAQAAEPSPTTSADRPISVAAFGGYGINNTAPDGADTFNVYGAGFGVRGGYTLPMKIYVGGLFQYNVGTSKDTELPPQLGGGKVSVSGRMMNLGAEGGYDLDAGQFTIRPYLGLGVGIAGGDLKLDKDGGTTKFSLWPGVQGVYNINDQLFAGLDARYTLVFADRGDNNGNANSLGFYGTVGGRF
ncbi:outer membrane beta-barrel protein [Pendulispora albinea]|uniref:Porin family protein n=1 Tax=Pendulispora albinea TaxID=2741071 RepID=A0ABZ2LJI0_9BACT